MQVHYTGAPKVEIHSQFNHILEARNPKWLFISEDRSLSESTIKLLRLDDLYKEGDTLDDAVKKTQEQWVAVIAGAGNRERADLRDLKMQKDQKETVLEVVYELKLVEPRVPSLTHYNYALCLGAFLDTVKDRLAAAIEAWESGVKFDSLVFLTGERTLRKDTGDKDDIQKIIDCQHPHLKFKEGWVMPENAPYETEYDMVCLIVDQVCLPEDMAKELEGKITIVNAPRGDLARPTTATTYKVWLDSNKPEKGSSILAFSTPLVWAYQDLAARTVLGDEYPLETVAPSFPNPNEHPALVSLVKDTVAKCLYEIDKSYKNINK